MYFVNAPIGRASKLIGAMALTAMTAMPVAAADSNVNATYRIYYNGISLGKMVFQSQVRHGRYQMSTNTRIKVPLLGAIFKSLSWKGATSASGVIRGNQPRPQKYHFEFRNSKKYGVIDMNFAGGRVARVARIPDKPLSPSAVPVKKAHLAGVVDPMSAIMLITRRNNSHRSACSRTIPVYDGKMRFNLRLSYKRMTRVSRSQSGGYSGPVVVCRVRYIPISGYKPHKKNIRFMANNHGIELWLMPLPKSRNYAPYQLKLPLQFGSASAYLTNFSIRTASGRKIALVR